MKSFLQWQHNALNSFQVYLLVCQQAFEEMKVSLLLHIQHILQHSKNFQQSMPCIKLPKKQCQEMCKKNYHSGLYWYVELLYVNILYLKSLT